MLLFLVVISLGQIACGCIRPARHMTDQLHWRHDVLCGTNQAALSALCAYV
jgi:hypothetical protein